MHSLQYRVRDRRLRKGEFRKLWISRINAVLPHQRHPLQPVDRRAGSRRRRGGPQGPGQHQAVTDAAAFAALVKVASEANEAKVAAS